MTLTVIRGLQQCSAADRWAVVAAIRGIALEATPQRVALVLAALGACFADEARISKPVYAAWRERQPRPDEWPSTKAIATTFKDSWKRAMAAFGAEAVLDVLVRDLSRDTVRFTKAEVVENLREYGRTGRPLQVDRYRVWARDRMGDPGRLCARYVLSAKTILDLFGSWEDALFAAGLGDRLCEGAGQRPNRRGPADGYTPERTAAWVARAFGAGPDGPVPARLWTKREFDAWAVRHEEAKRAEGRLVKVPRSEVVCRVHGGWGNALHAAGLISEAERLLRAGHRTEFRPDSELVAAVLEALGSKATSLRLADYRRFRLRRGKVDGRLLPSDALIRTRLGWERAIEQALVLRDGHGALPTLASPQPATSSRARARARATAGAQLADRTADRTGPRAADQRVEQVTNPGFERAARPEAA